MARIRLKRIYDPAAPEDGTRILVDRIWPRGISKASAALAFWSPKTAPSAALRKWYDHDPEKWSEFRRRYFAELDAGAEEVSRLKKKMTGKTITFLFASKEEEKNNAVALREYLEKSGDDG